jgi:hypothetical protein
VDFREKHLHFANSDVAGQSGDYSLRNQKKEESQLFQILLGMLWGAVQAPVQVNFMCTGICGGKSTPGRST